MTEDISYIPELPEVDSAVPEKKSKKTLWIILAVIAILLICCCVAVVIALAAGWFSSLKDAWDFYSLLPYVSFV
jgi:lipopolysaccharide/colanic/teichoic acid biosynthesis glycosyltransferase